MEVRSLTFIISPILQVDQIMVNTNIKLVPFCDDLKCKVQYRMIDYRF